MPYSNAFKKHRNDLAYYIHNKERIKKRERDKYRRFRNKIRSRRHELTTPELLQKNAAREKTRYMVMREIALAAYGDKCACCGERETLFLEFDHIKNDGATHRKQIGNSSMSLVRWLIENNFPRSFQILCSNCNQGKKRNGGICPHQLKNALSSLVVK